MYSSRTGPHASSRHAMTPVLFEPNHTRPRWLHALAAGPLLALMVASGGARAETAAAMPGGIKLSAKGFFTVGVAKSVRVRQPEDASALNCNCFVTEYSQGGIHEDGRVGYRADSKLGLQGEAAMADGRYSITGQVVARGARDGKVNLEWLYATAQISGNWTAQVGRKRLPLLAHSETQDVGVAIPWVRLPTQLYGWDIVNYNGANLMWRGAWGPVAVLANGYAGSETLKNSPYEAIYANDGSRTDTRWSGIRGFEVAMLWGDVRLRAAAVKARSSYVVTVPEEQPAFYDGAPLRMSTLSVSYEPGPWTFSAEGLRGDRRLEYGLDKSWSVQAGRRFGDVQVVLGHSAYRLVPSEPGSAVEADAMSSVVLRWDVAPGRAWKLQFDDVRDKSTGDMATGSRRLVSITYSGVF